MSNTIITNKLKYHTIVIEGIDKSGKDTLGRYLFELDKGKYLHISRGILSCIAYNKLYNRDYEYDLESHKNEVFILLNVNYIDWKIRCKLTNEPNICYTDNVSAFHYARDFLEKNNIKVYEFDTSSMTMFQIALYVIEIMYKLNQKC